MRRVRWWGRGLSPLARRAGMDALERVANARLFTALRQERGIAYQASLTFDDEGHGSGGGRGQRRYTIALTTADANAEEAVGAAREVVRLLATQARPVTRHEARVARHGLAAAAKARRRDPMWCARQLTVSWEEGAAEERGGAGADGRALLAGGLVAGRAYLRAVRRMGRDDLRALAGELEHEGDGVRIAIVSS